MKTFGMDWAKTPMMLLVSSMIAGDNDKDSANDSDSPAPDPEGTVTANISRNTGIDITNNGAKYGNIKWISPYNFSLEGNSYPSYSSVSICDLGTMRGLGDIVAIPSTGFTAPAGENTSIVCKPGHGYLVSFNANYQYIRNCIIYVRIYVVESVVNITGGITGAKVKYQYPFEQTALRLSTYNLKFAAEDDIPQTVEIITDTPSWNHIPEDWTNITVNNNTLSISVTPNTTEHDRDGYILIVAGEKIQSIRIDQSRRG
ncbi:MAG: hypothetical protein LBR10_01250 [Prevotellaceae bacterium]|jgi:hypothetical protein|nr:hypothetical protein [Prevotellaceae bacterium]